MTDQLDGDFQLLAAKFPTIAKALGLLRGHPEAAMYVTKLLADTREHARQGFPPEVLTALLNIQETHQKLVKDDTAEENPWGRRRDIFR
jgi:hypothetical protein